MTALEYILEALEAALTLERELGVRSFELEKPLGEASKAGRPFPAADRTSPPAPVAPAPPAAPAAPAPSPASPPAPPAAPAAPAAARLVFLNDKAPSEKLQKVISGSIARLGLSPEEAPLVFDGPMPTAQVYIVLGSRALNKWLPGKAAAPGMWLRTDSGKPVIVTATPDKFLRFDPSLPSVGQMKRDLWNAFRAAAAQLQR